MYDPSGLTNTTGNAGRGYQGQQTPLNFSSLGNLFTGGGQSGGGTGSAPMNMMPQNPAAQPGNNFQGFMSMLGGAFNGNNAFARSWQQSPLGQVFGARSAPGYTPEFGANMPQYLAEQAIANRQRGGTR